MATDTVQLSIYMQNTRYNIAFWDHLAGRTQSSVVSRIANTISAWQLFCLFQAKNEQELEQISQNLLADKVDHKLWIEQPENFPTCLATKPYPKEQIQKYFKKLRLYK